MSEYKKKEISLEGNRKLINACKKAGLECFNPKGKWNGYGYEKLPMAVKIKSLSEMRKFNSIKRELENVYQSAPLTQEEKTEKWCKRLSKLTNIPIEYARQIADEKLEYQQEQIDLLNDRQVENYSIKRQILINKISSSNPLRYIKDAEHAENILQAHNRHNNSNYEELLDKARDMAAYGDIEKDEVKDFARKNMEYYNDEPDICD